jgi:hypothetical protein
MSILGIDPGLSGALVRLNYDGQIEKYVDMPTIKAGKRRQIAEVELAREVEKLIAVHVEAAWLELVGVRPGEGALGAFSFGKGYGLIRGLLRAHCVPIRDVTPAVWKRSVGIPSGAGKDASRAMAQELWQDRAEIFSRVKDEGRAEACLIAHHGRLKLRKEAA